MCNLDNFSINVGELSGFNRSSVSEIDKEVSVVRARFRPQPTTKRNISSTSTHVVKIKQNKTLWGNRI